MLKRALGNGLISYEAQMKSKADQVLLRSLEIAQRRVQGETWPSIAVWLRSEGLSVSGDQLRVYWWRRYDNKPPSAIVAEAEAAISVEQRDSMAVQITGLTRQLWALDQLVIDLHQNLANAQADLGEAMVERALANELTAKYLQLEHVNADLSWQLARANEERQGWKNMHAQLRQELDEARTQSQAQQEQQSKKLEAAHRTVREWQDFCRELAADHKAKDSAGVRSRLDHLVKWAAKRADAAS